jgi:hypothetical protein
MQNLGSDADEIFTFVVWLAVLAAIVSTKSSASLLTDIGSAMSSLIGIVLNPVGGSASK